MSSKVTIGYVTDIEGNYDYWLRYIAISKVLVVAENGELSLRDSCHLVFGGDVCDRGPGDLRIIQDLLRLKEKYPSRTHFILGNRDTNKLRFLVELHESNLRRRGKAYWVDSTSEKEVETAAERLQWVREISS
jgi:hypothetical protein